MALPGNSLAADERWVARVRETLGPLRAPIDTLTELARADAQQAYVVGGVVRDALMAHAAGGQATPVRDVDVVVLGPAIALAEALQRRLGGTLEKSPRFGTASLKLAGLGTLDFATARSERYVRAGALPIVTPTRTLADDLGRRDFSLNAMAAALDGTFALQDPTGGQEALARRELVVLHDQSFVDDPTRLWRGARLAARLGLRWAPATAELARAAARAHVQATLTPARLGGELALTLCEPEPQAVFDALAQLDLLAQLGLGPAQQRRFSEAAARMPSLCEQAPGWLVPRPTAAKLYALVLAFVLERDAPLASALVQTGLAATALRPHRQALIAAGRRAASKDDSVEFAAAMRQLLPQERAALWADLHAGSAAALILRWAERDWKLETVVTAAALRERGVPASPALAKALDAALRSALAGEDAEQQLRAALHAAFDSSAEGGPQ